MEDEKTGKQYIWLVWDIDTRTKPYTAALRAITTSEERARKYEKSIMKAHIEEFGNPYHYVDVEKRITNHLFGGTLLQTIGAELKVRAVKK